MLSLVVARRPVWLGYIRQRQVGAYLHNESGPNEGGSMGYYADATHDNNKIRKRFDKHIFQECQKK